MAVGNLPQTVKPSIHRQPSMIFLSPEEREKRKADKGGLRMIGGNIGIAFPICVDVIDEHSNVFSLNFEELLNRLNEFTTYIGRRRESEVLLHNCFTAYEYKLMTEQEKSLFESFVCTKIASVTTQGGIEVAKRLLLRSTD